MYLKDISLQPGQSPIEGETIRSIAFGEPTRKTGFGPGEARPYHYLTLTMTSGKVFVLSSLMGEVCIRQLEA